MWRSSGKFLLLMVAAIDASRICPFNVDCTDYNISSSTWFQAKSFPDPRAKVVFLDYDLTLSTGDLSEQTRDRMCGGKVVAPAFSCPCFNATEDTCGPSNVNAMVDTLMSVPDWQDQTLSNFAPVDYYNPTGVPSLAAPRLRDLRQTLAKLREAGADVYMLSTSWYPVTAAQWAAYLLKADSVSKLGFDKDHVIALPVAVPGQGADKGAAIAKKLRELGLGNNQCVFADDSKGNIQSAAAKCSTIWISQRHGLEESDLFYLLRLADPFPQSSSVLFNM